MSGNIIDYKNGKYRLRYDYKGKTHAKTITCDNTKKLPKLLNDFIYEIEHSDNTSSIYFNDFAKQWLNDYVYTNLELRTQEFYEGLLDNHIYNYFNGLRLNEIKRSDVILFLNELQDKYTKSTLKQYRNCLVTIFNYAIKLDLITGNPATLVDLPKGKVLNKKENVLQESDIKLLLEKLEDVDLEKKLIIKLALFGGLRRQEILALTKSDINFNENSISINKAVSKSKRSGVFTKAPKTAKSNRIVYLPENLIQKLKTLPNEKLFDIDMDYMSKWFYRWVLKNNLPHITLHGLRHTTATMLISHNVDYKTVSSILGHSNTSTTLNIYTHKVDENIKNASKIFDNPS